MLGRFWPVGGGHKARVQRRARPLARALGARALGWRLSLRSIFARPILHRPALRPLLLAALIAATGNLPARADGFGALRLSFGASLSGEAAAVAAEDSQPGLPDLDTPVAEAAIPAPGVPAALEGVDLPRREVTLAERQEQARRRTAERMAKTRREVPIRVTGSGHGRYITSGQAKVMQVADSEFQCLAETLYFEARGESAKGQAAVAEVILNRVDSGRFPNTICGVVKQGNTGACQFSYNCGDNSRQISDRAAFARVQTVARRALEGAPRDLTDGATYFHTPAVRPDWSRRFVRTVQIDNHIFYRPGVRVAAR